MIVFVRRCVAHWDRACAECEYGRSAGLSCFDIFQFGVLYSDMLGGLQVVDDEDGKEHFIKPTRIRTMPD